MTQPAAPKGWINVQLYGDTDQVEAMLQHLDSALNPVGLLSFLQIKVSPFLRERMENRFAQEGDEVSGAWAPLTEATQQIRGNLGFPPDHPINVRTGDLYNYIVNSPDDLLTTPLGAVLVMPGEPPTNSELKSKVEVAQKGRGNTPARPVLGMNHTDLAFVLAALAEHVTEGLP